MAFLPPVVGCLVKKGLQKGGSRSAQDPPGYALAWNIVSHPLCPNLETRQKIALGSLPLWFKANAIYKVTIVRPKGLSRLHNVFIRVDVVLKPLSFFPLQSLLFVEGAGSNHRES